jgi:hypothetical protein
MIRIKFWEVFDLLGIIQYNRNTIGRKMAKSSELKNIKLIQS